MRKITSIALLSAAAMGMLSTAQPSPVQAMQSAPKGYYRYWDGTTWWVTASPAKRYCSAVYGGTDKRGFSLVRDVDTGAFTLFVVYPDDPRFQDGDTVTIDTLIVASDGSIDDDLVEIEYAVLGTKSGFVTLRSPHIDGKLIGKFRTGKSVSFSYGKDLIGKYTLQDAPEALAQQDACIAKMKAS